VVELVVVEPEQLLQLQVLQYQEQVALEVEMQPVVH
jgi:hypothetical protein